MKTADEYLAGFDPGDMNPDALIEAARGLVKAMRDDFCNEMNAWTVDPSMSSDTFVNLCIGKIREYNRVWNQMAEKNPILAQDAFLGFMKKVLAAPSMDNDPLARAARYL